MLRLQEGPHSTLPEDEFFDAVESGLDKIEEDRQLRVRLKLQSQQQVRKYILRCFRLHLHTHMGWIISAATEKWPNCMHADCVCGYNGNRAFVGEMRIPFTVPAPG